MKPGARHAKRGDQPLVGQLGAHFTSPKKRRLPSKKQMVVDSFATKAKIARLKEQKRAIEERSRSAKAASTGSVAGPSGTAPGLHAEPAPCPPEIELQSEHHADIDIPETNHDDSPFTAYEPEPQPPKTKRLVPTDKDERLYQRWADVVPALIAPYLRYSQTMLGQDWRGLPEKFLKPDCAAPQTCTVVVHKVTAVLFSSMFHQSLPPIVGPC